MREQARIVHTFLGGRLLPPSTPVPTVHLGHHGPEYGGQSVLKSQGQPSAHMGPMTSSSGTRVGLVGCASQKLTRPEPARQLYVSQLFWKASAYAEATCDRWYVLSAKHGLVHPDAVIEPYDMRLGTNHKTSPPIHAWADMVRYQLDAELVGLEGVTLVALAGEQYRTALLHSI